MASKTQEAQNVSVNESKVEVVIFNSPPLIVSVPADLEMRDPAFIQYVTQEALNNYKELIRWELQPSSGCH